MGGFRRDLFPMLYYFEAENADGVWNAATAKLLERDSSSFHHSRAGNTLELLHVVLQIHDPRQRWLSNRREALNVAFALAEVIWILDGRNDAAFVNYFNRRLPHFAGKGATYYGAYGERLRHRFGFDQLKRVALALQGNPASRQAVLQIWDAETDLPSDAGVPAASDIPCNLVSMLQVREGKLDWTQIMRSNDAYLGTPHNIIQFTMLQEVVAGWIGTGVGSYTHWSNSFHLYERDIAPCPIDYSKLKLPLNSDSLAISLPEFIDIWHEVREVALVIIDERNSSDALLSCVRRFSGPSSWKNILCVIAAEGLRRRGATDATELVVSWISNPLWLELWRRWGARIASKTS